MRQPGFAAALAAVVLLGSRPLGAQAPPAGSLERPGPTVAAARVAAPRPAAAGPRVLAPGDEVQIKVLDHPEYDLALPVPRSGGFTFPGLGPLTLAGRTTIELEETIREGLEGKGFLREPQVSVFVKVPAKNRVYVLKGVKYPQAYEVPAGTDLYLTQALSLAGGLLPEADPGRVRVLRRRPGGERSVLTVDLREILQAGRIELDPLMEPDDTVVVDTFEKDQNLVYVTGKVKTPGSYPIPREGLSAFRAIVLAGGFDKYASPNDTILIRKGPDGEKAYKVDVREILKGMLKADIALRPNDIIVVPESFF
jgi:polysaccharide export outer membrane protein